MEDLRSYLDALTDAVDAGADGRAVGAPRRWPAVLAVAAAMAIIVVGLVAALSDGEDTRSVGTADERPSEPAVEEPGDPLAGTWRPLEDRLPVADGHTAAVWTGSALLAVYPENEGHDVAIQVWDGELEQPRLASPSGLPWRAFPTIVWTGEEVLVIGGSNGPGIDRPAVAYDTATDSWRDLAAPPGFVPGRSENVVDENGAWTGSEVLFAGQGLAYRPSTDSWRRIPPAPPDAVRPGGAVVVTDEHLVVWGGCPDDVTDDVCASQQLATTGGAIFDLDTETWRTLPAGGPMPGAEVLGTWTGTEVVLVSTRTGSEEPAGTVAAYDPAADEWRALPDPPFEPTGRTRLVATPGTAGMSPGVVLIGEGMPASILEIRARRWRQLGSEPFTSGTAATWADGHLAVIGNTYVFEPAGVRTEDTQSMDGPLGPSEGAEASSFEPFTMRYRTLQAGGGTVEAEWTLDYTSTERWSMELVAVDDPTSGMQPGARRTLRAGTLTQTFGAYEPPHVEEVDGPMVPLAILSRGPLPDHGVDSLFGLPAEPSSLEGRSGYRTTETRDCPEDSIEGMPECSRAGEQTTLRTFYAFNDDGVPVFARTWIPESDTVLWQLEVLDYERRS